jgi:hypothetical protein
VKTEAPGKRVPKKKTKDRKEADIVSIATAVILNVVAIVGLLALLAATMRLPYHLPMPPGSGDPAPDGKRRRKTSPASRSSRRGRPAPEPVYER